jgi:hypothetical protein
MPIEPTQSRVGRCGFLGQRCAWQDDRVTGQICASSRVRMGSSPKTLENSSTRTIVARLSPDEP